MSAFNLSCGVLGHIDSGKTSVCKVLSQITSTAALDKHPQSRERGITLDLGFSSFILAGNSSGDETQVTLVDCPGHASLIRTVLGGAHMMDLCLLIVDAQKGFQIQTAECLVIAEIVTTRLIIVVNKTDLIDSSTSTSYKAQMDKKIRSTMKGTIFGDSCPIIFVSAHSGEGIPDLICAVRDISQQRPNRVPSGPLHIAYDHAFQIKGQGTVFTGTVLSGTVRRGQSVYFPYTLESAEVRSIEKFRNKSESAIQGDRIGLCVPGVQPYEERGDIYSTPDALISSTKFVFLVETIRFYKRPIENGSKLHVSFGHTHSMGTVYFFKSTGGSKESAILSGTPNIEYSQRNECLLDRLRGKRDHIVCANIPNSRFELIDDIHGVSKDESVFCLVLLPKRLKLLSGAPMVASKLDLDEEYHGCRLVLYGLHVDFPEGCLHSQILRRKRKEGVIERVHTDGSTYLIRGLIKKNGSDPSRFINKTIHHSSSGIEGRIISTFGKSGLLRVELNGDLPENAVGTRIHIELEKSALSKILTSHC